MLAGIANGFAGDDSLAIACDRAIVGKHVPGACLPFALDLYSRFTQAGGETHLVVFDWCSSTDHGTHAIVVYRDQEGRYWGMDNLHSRPVWLQGSTPQAWAEFFAPRLNVGVKAHRTSSAFAGHYADRSRISTRAQKKSPDMFATK